MQENSNPQILAEKTHSEDKVGFISKGFNMITRKLRGINNNIFVF